MRLMIDLGEWAERYEDYAVALLAGLKQCDPEVELFAHLFDPEKGRGTAALKARQKLAMVVDDSRIIVTPYPLSGERAEQAVAEAPSLQAGLQVMLCRHVSQAVFGRCEVDSVLRLAPIAAHEPIIPTVAQSRLEYPPVLPLDPDEGAPISEETCRRLRRCLDTADLRAGAVDPAVGHQARGARKRLAMVSPLPPLQTGIADYSVELVEAMAPYYDITLIVEQQTVEPAWLHQRFAIRDSQWFMEYGDSFDHVLYHWGNSPFHRHMLALIERHPGTLVLHDFYSGNIARSLAEEYDEFARMLYQAHGYDAVASLLEEISQAGLENTLDRYPLNHAVVSRATGVLVHSDYALELAGRWYPEPALKDWRKVPFLRQLTKTPTPHQNDQGAREAARQALGLADNAFLICTFGLVTPNKCVQELFDALQQSGLAQYPDVRLVVVGGYGHDAYRHQLERWLKQYAGHAAIEVTGYAEPQTYRHYLQAADVGVQLRTSSRGETSAAVFDCLAAGLPLVANAHGSVRELAPEAACLLPDPLTVTDLADALRTLYHAPEQRCSLGASGHAHVKANHSAEVAGLAYARAIDALHQQSRQGQYLGLLDDIQCLARREGLDLSGENLGALSESIDVSMPPPQPPRLLLDVSNISGHDLRTGIERVTRNLCDVLLNSPPESYRVELVRSVQGQLHHARAYAAERLAFPHSLGEDEPLTARQGDIYLSLEWSPPVLAENYAQFQALKARGVKLYFTVFDALPVQFPQHFPGFVEGTYQDWLSRVLRLADGLCCISAAVADDIRRETQRLPEPLRPKGELPPLNHFHLGADFTARAASHGMRRADEAVLEQLGSDDAPVFLMVGTLEPRKGHAHVLGAMEKCWQAGSNARLVIVGKRGWHMDAMAKRLTEHFRAGRELFWIEGASDDMLAELYRTSTALIAASEGEGFGLPLIEAAQWGIPIIARDIPVFREVAGTHASYFSATDAEGLARELEQWLEDNAAGNTPNVAGMPWLDWRQSATQLLRLVLPDESLSPASEACLPPA